MGHALSVEYTGEMVKRLAGLLESGKGPGIAAIARGLSAFEEGNTLLTFLIPTFYLTLLAGFTHGADVKMYVDRYRQLPGMVDGRVVEPKDIMKGITTFGNHVAHDNDQIFRTDFVPYDEMNEHYIHSLSRQSAFEGWILIHDAGDEKNWRFIGYRREEMNRYSIFNPMALEDVGTDLKHVQSVNASELAALVRTGVQPQDATIMFFTFRSDTHVKKRSSKVTSVNFAEVHASRRSSFRKHA